MTTKDLIIQALDEVPESALPEILEYVRDRKVHHSQPLIRKEVWDAYEASLREREEVYRRLADS
ncbi:MAG: DUF2281 domain-containing protein [Leptolyngbyaceae cyanobacterium RM1_406_9]|nr:DUF2281 domain-containing protein [Leptolyngbyaceae cyanobacterium RM1_406_9]